MIPHRNIDIAGRMVGPGEPCYVIAEAGSNHNGDLDLALRLIDLAAETGCDAVKFQVFRPEELTVEDAPQATYLDGFLGGKSIYDLFRRSAIDRAWLPKLASHARDVGVQFISTPFDVAAVGELVDAGAVALKNASSELWHHELVAAEASTGLPVIMSTGMATLGEVEAAVEVATENGCEDLALLHCTVSYPAPADTLNLRAMATLASAFNHPVGLSDHSEGTWAAVAAVALGAVVIEKHITISRELKGPDHPFAIEPAELAALVRDVRAVEVALGDGRKIRHPVEEEIYEIGRRNLVALRDLGAGDVVHADDLAALRGPLGIKPALRDAVVGRTLSRPVTRGRSFSWEDFR